ncbi:MAG TPA: gluconokinase [Chitinophagaceae bacterium]
MFPSIIYIMGVSGSGKTTVGRQLAAETGLPFFDGDDFHPASNIDKMKSGQPLTDDDRVEWLHSINEMAQSQSKNAGAIIACSALKEKYRSILAKGITISVQWIFLRGTYELISERMQQRSGHFMQANLLQSQFDILEIPANAITIDINNTTDDIVNTIRKKL